MKLFVPLTALALLLFLPTAQPAALSYHVDIKCELKRLEVRRNASESTEKTEESWAYHVTISNHSFKAIPDLRVEYLVFSSRQSFGSTDGAKEVKPTSGNKALGTLENNAQTSFDTDPVTLKKARLKGRLGLHQRRQENGAGRSQRRLGAGIFRYGDDRRVHAALLVEDAGEMGGVSPLP